MLAYSMIPLMLPRRSSRPAPNLKLTLKIAVVASGVANDRASRRVLWQPLGTGTVGSEPRGYFRFWRHSGPGRTCYWLDPVANDP
ncbi:hypothetical protein ABIF68_007122 [Bradyrhizobium japonicum]